MTRRLIAVEIDGTIMSLRGWQAHGLAVGAGLRPTYNGVRKAWVADTKRLPAFAAYLEHRNVPYAVTDSELKSLEVLSSVPVESPDSPEQLDLFGGVE